MFPSRLAPWLALALLAQPASARSSAVRPLPAPQSTSLPPGFVAESLPGWFDLGTDLLFAPDGTLLLAEKAGRVRVHDGASFQTTPLIDLSAEVNCSEDRGLLGVAVHPGWTPDGGGQSWIYLLYTVSPVAGLDPAHNEDELASFSRLTRYQVRTEAGELLAELGSRQILLGHLNPDGLAPDGIASLGGSHSNGELLFGVDGTLLLAIGDGSIPGMVDLGGLHPWGFEDFIHPVTGQRGPNSLEQDSGAFRARDLRSLAGKVLRINPDTGKGLPSNPFFDGDPNSNPSRVWALGLRNPFRMSLMTNTGKTDPSLGEPGALFVSDVGWYTSEELNIVRGGENLGWPCRIAHTANKPYEAASQPPNAYSYPDCSSPAVGTPTPPTLAFNHSDPSLVHPPGLHVDAAGAPLGGFIGRAVIAGPAYSGGAYPAEYDGRAFFADFAGRWIRSIELGPDLAPVSIHDFAMNAGRVIDLEAHPLSGDLYSLSYEHGLSRVLRYRFQASAPPVAVLTSVQTVGPAPLGTGMHGLASSDPENEDLSFTWDFGDGWPAVTGAVHSHAYKREGLFELTMTVEDPQGHSGRDATLVAVGPQAPAARVLLPDPSESYDPGVAVTLVGACAGVSDPSYAWSVDRITGGGVQAGIFQATGDRAVFVPTKTAPAGILEYYRIVLQVSDGGSQVAHDRVHIYPAEHLFDATGDALPIARVFELTPPHPTGGGALDVEVLRDGVLPDLATGDHHEQFTTWHGQQGDDDWIGWEFATPPTPEQRFVGLMFQEGLHQPVGGWWKSLNVEVRQGATWTEVPGLRIDPAYPFHLADTPLFDGYAFQSYALGFDPVAGDAIRMRGAPGGSVGFVSVGELRVLSIRDLPYGDKRTDITSDAVSLVSSIEGLDPAGPQGSGNPDPETLRNGTCPPLGSSSLLAQFDTEHGGKPGGQDWLGWRFEEVRTFTRVLLQEGLHSPSGGWFEAEPFVEVQPAAGAAWQQVQGLSITPPYVPDGSATSSYRSFQLDFTPVAAVALRLRGTPGGASGYLSAGELTLFEPSLPPGCGISQYGLSAGNANLLTLDSHTPPAPGLPLVFQIAGGPSASVGWVGVSLYPSEWPAYGGTMLVNPSALKLFMPVSFDADGDGHLELMLPGTGGGGSTQLGAATVFAQSFAHDPQAPVMLLLSNGLEISICEW